MSKLYEAYKTDKTAEAQGVWVDEASCRFKLARMGGANTKYQRALSAAMKPHLRELQLGVLDESVAEPIFRKVFIETVLLDWEDVTDEADVPMAYSRDNAAKLFEDLPDLYARLRELANSYANFRAAAIAVAAKN